MGRCAARWTVHIAAELEVPASPGRGRGFCPQDLSPSVVGRQTCPQKVKLGGRHRKRPYAGAGIGSGHVERALHRCPYPGHNVFQRHAPPLSLGVGSKRSAAHHTHWWVAGGQPPLSRLQRKKVLFEHLRRHPCPTGKLLRHPPHHCIGGAGSPCPDGSAALVQVGLGQARCHSWRCGAAGCEMCRR